MHECGHAIVACAIGNSAALQKLSVVARGRGRGGATVYSSEDKLMLTHLDLTKNLITGMAGVAAEDYVFGMLSTGGEEDLEQATKTAHAMVSVYGMSEAIGPVTVGEKEGAVFVGGEGSKTANVAAATQELIDSETRRLVHEAEETAEQILEMNQDVLDQIANTLVDQRDARRRRRSIASSRSSDRGRSRSSRGSTARRPGCPCASRPSPAPTPRSASTIPPSQPTSALTTQPADPPAPATRSRDHGYRA